MQDIRRWGQKINCYNEPNQQVIRQWLQPFPCAPKQSFYKQVTVCAVATERSISARKCRPTSFSASNTSSYTAECQNGFVTLPPPIGTTSGKSEEVRPCQNEDSDLTNVEQGTKRQTTDDPPCGSDLKRRPVQSDKPNCGNK